MSSPRFLLGAVACIVLHSSAAKAEEVIIGQFRIGNYRPVTFGPHDIVSTGIGSMFGSDRVAIVIQFEESLSSTFQSMTEKGTGEYLEFSLCGLVVSSGVKILAPIRGPAMIAGLEPDEVSWMIEVMRGQRECDAVAGYVSG